MTSHGLYHQLLEAADLPYLPLERTEGYDDDRLRHSGWCTDRKPWWGWKERLTGEQAPRRRVLVADVMARELTCLSSGCSKREATRLLAESSHNGFPVISREGHLLGLLLRDELERAEFEDDEIVDQARPCPELRPPDQARPCTRLTPFLLVVPAVPRRWTARRARAPPSGRCSAPIGSLPRSACDTSSSRASMGGRLGCSHGMTCSTVAKGRCSTSRTRRTTPTALLTRAQLAPPLMAPNLPHESAG